MDLRRLFTGRPGPTPHAEARAVARDGVAVYWRPGCPYCLRLTTGLRGVAARAAWVNIWDDEDGRAFVRSVNDGNETVPTVVIDGVAHTNPSPALVRRALAGRGGREA